jgi:hypothetical protein
MCQNDLLPSQQTSAAMHDAVHVFPLVSQLLPIFSLLRLVRLHESMCGITAACMLLVDACMSLFWSQSHQSLPQIAIPLPSQSTSARDALYSIPKVRWMQLLHWRGVSLIDDPLLNTVRLVTLHRVQERRRSGNAGAGCWLCISADDRARNYSDQKANSRVIKTALILVITL